MARITAEELSAMLEAGQPVMILDLRSAMESDADGIPEIPGALRIPMEELLARRHGDSARPRDRAVLQLSE